MRRSIAARLAVLVLTVAAGTCSAQNWVEGKNYFRVTPPQPTSVPAGKVEVMEVFSYGCPACNAFQPIIKQLKAALPPNAQMVYLPASFIPSEDWPMFQRAYFTAQALGIADKTHDAMFNAVWVTGELAAIDPQTHRIKSTIPTIEDAAKFYERTAGVKADKFLATAKSFGVDAKMRMADAEIGSADVTGTPTIIVNGKYRLQPQSAGGIDQMIQLVKYLVAQESGAASAAK
jgi:protein dithiol oxidoreductase (disulfide-forming)